MNNKNDYKDIIDLPNHVSKNHPRMDKITRAAQFAPFSALTGYAEAINEVGRIVEEKKEISEDDFLNINDILNFINNNLNKKMIIEITYFEKDKLKNGGIYKFISGYLKKINLIDKTIQILNNEPIKLENIIKIHCDEYDKLNNS